MALMKGILVLHLCSLIASGFNTNDQVYADINYGSFQNPSNSVRPRFRYWVPDASADPDTVNSDIIGASERGIGGVEYLGYYLYGGGEAGDIPVDWSLYGWGTPAWKSILDVGLQTSSDSGLLFDFPLGPNQGAGVPAPADSDGLLWELLPFNVTVPAGTAYNDTIPGWGSGDLVSASIGLALETVNTTLINHADFGNTPTPGNRTTLAFNSLQDLTSQVDSQGRLATAIPSSGTGIGYYLFAYYQVRSGYREAPSPEDPGFPAVPQSPVTTYVQNGSWVVDHFSAVGAKVVTDFWDQYLLPNGTQQLLQSVGNYGWEDSQEFGQGVTVWWTPQLLERFSSARGYNLSTLLPLIFYGDNGVDGALPTDIDFLTDEADAGFGHVEDYRQTLTELNQDYLNALSLWCQQTLQSQFSAQIGYNLQMDMLANIPHVNAPETESLDFNHLIDAFRQYSGPANLAGKRVVSSELGAERSQAYQETISEIIWNVKRSVVGSINQFVFHGLAYSGVYPGCTWPGFTTFAFRFSEMHGPHQPAWDYYSDFLNWTARMQWIAQSGVPQFDIALWLKNETWDSIETKYVPTDLVDAGYNYQYLSPDNFDLPNAVVSNGQLAPDAQAFNALVVRANDSLTSLGLDSLVEFAQAGLPIFFSGGVPSMAYGANATLASSINSTLSSVQSLPNVHVVPYENLAASLQSFNIRPRVLSQISATNSNATWYTYWRKDNLTSTDYIVAYNDAAGIPTGGGSTSGNLTIASTGTPWHYDAWIGAVTPILVYSQDENSTTVVPGNLAGNQSIVIAFTQASSETPCNGAHFVSAPNIVVGVTTGADNTSLIVKSIAANSTNQAPLQLANGTTVALTTSTASPLILNSWNLTIESWSPPENVSAIDSVIANSSYVIDQLVAWADIPNTNLQNMSGRGYYSTSFDVPATWNVSTNAAGESTGGALLVLPAVTHSLRVFVNGQQLPPLDITAPQADITQHLAEPDASGSSKGNQIEAIVASPLGNAARSVWSDLMCGGLPAQGPLPLVADYGLIGQVQILPLLTTVVDL